jgi:hypothetical protein
MTSPARPTLRIGFCTAYGPCRLVELGPRHFPYHCPRSLFSKQLLQNCFWAGHWSKTIMAVVETREWYAPQCVPIGGRGQVDVLVNDKGTSFFMKLCKPTSQLGDGRRRSRDGTMIYREVTHMELFPLPAVAV